MKNLFCFWTVVLVLILVRLLHAQVDNSFQMQSLENGSVLFFTPFAEINVFLTDLPETKEVETLRQAGWSKNKDSLNIKTSDGRTAIFAKTKFGWEYTYKTDKKVMERMNVNLIGIDLLKKLVSNSAKNPTQIFFENNELTIYENGLTNTKKFILPKGINIQTINNGNIIILWDDLGYYFTDINFIFKSTSKFIILYHNPPTSTQNNLNNEWTYIIGNVNNQITDIQTFINNKMDDIYLRECDLNGTNRHKEKLIHQKNGLTKIFYDFTNQTARLGNGWNNPGTIYSGKEFVVEQNDQSWLVKISKDNYTIQIVKKL